MQVILQEEISSLGKAGEIVNVKEGYARNFLIPQKKAVVADAKNMKMLEHQRKIISAKQAKLKAEAEKLAVELNKLKLVFEKEVGEEGKLFGSITSKDIAELVKEKGFEIDRRKLQLKDPIREIGDCEVPLKLHAEVTAMLKVSVEKK
ncbi:MAG: 50S ribosomal protein L9 [Deltaproteobacteria bacterium CG_4_10_14_0_2_um_filter_43_8]|nr:MAG: 50S ribosomal protein L9 [Deltaproteobacteria bacterium CG11_big_fil_rev_8_21_14_0_20_42_23]PJA21070.1 MAG: 50S ribosomal protein L9 [Deltaproteobacteria bacterium CG_4_10_14_0_2_um_filter_43_8]PJC64699.1 MAG: 50S ribosomal protein L9 [Deltaproteobacteria bacterium CG_4_9_14_0_2_um_filter_42_21]